MVLRAVSRLSMIDSLFQEGLELIITICLSDPDTLKKGMVHRPSMSQYLPQSWKVSKRRSFTSTSSMGSVYSTCSSEEGDAFSSSESDEVETEETAEIEEEGESKLSLSECS